MQGQNYEPLSIEKKWQDRWEQEKKIRTKKIG